MRARRDWTAVAVAALITVLALAGPGWHRNHGHHHHKPACTTQPVTVGGPAIEPCGFPATHDWTNPPAFTLAASDCLRPGCDTGPVFNTCNYKDGGIYPWTMVVGIRVVWHLDGTRGVYMSGTLTDDTTQRSFDLDRERLWEKVVGDWPWRFRWELNPGPDVGTWFWAQWNVTEDPGYPHNWQAAAFDEASQVVCSVTVTM